MIILIAGAIGVVSALWSVERAKRLAALPLRRVWLVWGALVVQIAVLEALAGVLPPAAGEVLHLGTYAMLVAFLVVNRQLPGAMVIAAGTACNLTAIAANGGTMPADPDAWAFAGKAPITAGEFANSATLAEPRLLFLGDIFAVPASWPLANVFSIGDVLIVIGATYLAHRWCSRPLPAADENDADDDDGDAVAAASRVVTGADGEIRTLTDEDLNLVPLPVGLRRPDPAQDTEVLPPAPTGQAAAWPAPVAVRVGLGGQQPAPAPGHAVVIDIAVPSTGAAPGTSVTIRTTTSGAPAGPGRPAAESVVTEVTLQLGANQPASSQHEQLAAATLPPPAAQRPARRFVPPSDLIGARPGTVGAPMLTTLPGSGDVVSPARGRVLPPPAPVTRAPSEDAGVPR